ncbi:MAG: prepilin-type N-terminal cleavage/methylation domain-containing protein [Actinobacteria bacterium]|nr:MAG: prepilin-type N-terminal cleavage/methylation domain-containing protein [Actinomycetota bacterium]
MMNRLRDDSGFSLTEMIVVTLLMGLVLGAVYMTIDFSDRATRIAETQAAFAQSIAAPMDAMDVAFSQNIDIVGTTVPPVTVGTLDGNSVTLQMPPAYSGAANTTYYRTFSAGTDGRLVEQMWYLSGTTKNVVRNTTWSTENANRVLGKPMFSYYSQGGTPTADPAQVRSVNVSVWTRHEGRDFSDSRRIYFRNR